MVAVMVASPALTPVTTPAESTDALLASLLFHFTGRPFTMPPALSYAVATSVTLVPTRIVDDAGATLITETGRLDTETGTSALTPPALTESCVLPDAMPVTMPLAFTPATLEFSTVQTRRCPRSSLPCASFATAEIARVSPVSMEMLVGLTSMVATGEVEDGVESLHEESSSTGAITIAASEASRALDVRGGIQSHPWGEGGMKAAGRRHARRTVAAGADTPRLRHRGKIRVTADSDV